MSWRIFSHDKSVNEADYTGLHMHSETRKMLKENPQMFLACCNGVGSKVGFWKRLLRKITPNTIWFLNISKPANIHDVEYTYPLEFKTLTEALRHKSESDDRFYWNLLELIQRAGGIFKGLREKRAFAYYRLLSTAGEESFLENKIIGEK